jgi:cysteine-S-conjugate beta-lyase
MRVYNFDEIFDRRNSDSIKWNYYPADALPMWVADMDFKSPPAIIDALRARADHGLFGYTKGEMDLPATIVGWCKRRYNWDVSRDEVVMLPGLVSGLNIVARAFGAVGDSTITFTPVYPPFLSSAAEQGMTAIQVPMTPVYTGATLRYEIDFDAFEKAITPRTRMFVMCHPQNPAGREFTREELTRLGEICLRHKLLICSDEIHGDLMLDGRKHAPFATMSPEIADSCVTLMAPSKTFNVPGLGCSFAVVKNPQLRQRMKSAMSGIIPHVNIFGLVACEAAFTQCDDWLTELQAYLTANRNVMTQYLAERIPSIKTTVAEATYLAFFDVRETGIPGDPFTYLLNTAKVATNAGPMFGKGGEGYVRFNFGCPRATLLQALDRIAESLGGLR